MTTTLKQSPKSWLERQLPEEEEIVSPFFTIEKQPGSRAVNIDFQFENGDRLGLPCSDIRKIEFEASKGIALHWPDETIRILGRNLEKLYHYLLQHRVCSIIADVSDLQTEKMLVITQLIREHERLE